MGLIISEELHDHQSLTVSKLNALIAFVEHHKGVSASDFLPCVEKQSNAKLSDVGCNLLGLRPLRDFLALVSD